MNQKSIVLYLSGKGWMARVIHDDLIATPSEEAIASGTVTKYLRKVQISPGDPIESSNATSPHIDDSDEAILTALEELSVSSVRQLAHATHLSVTLVYR
jgi:hypothetical protein